MFIKIEGETYDVPEETVKKRIRKAFKAGGRTQAIREYRHMRPDVFCIDACDTVDQWCADIAEGGNQDENKS